MILSVMLLLIKYAYNNTKSEYGKFTVSYVILFKDSDITFREDWNDLPIFDQLYKLILNKSEIYGSIEIKTIIIRIYLSDQRPCESPLLSYEEVGKYIFDSLNSNVVIEHKEPRKIRASKKKRIYSKFITTLKTGDKLRQHFIVANTETIMIKEKQNPYTEVHVPYAIGFLLVRSGNDICYNMIETYFSESYITHNVINAKKYTIKPLMRNNRLYEVVVFNDNKLIFNLRDSLTPLPRSLKDLAQNLCPHLRIKGPINHDDIKLDNLSSLKYQLIVITE
ncbi:uncharacterized protein LOC127123597 [Lathyrus oleraceus]|uniref:uncharacterized protein LOC127103514 n=1 Tax=Pisum sativum TaxID=3888 RepID=UPI0021D0A6D5|nr:uncharacterized protein LOC127103514 [Pisum sativum]XP_050909757.1 uncharacterized protein LOC127123596 [Pisum sativum]XP_050909758.1 uncharacterized protein LOC127123597 [Pisum sativum]